jgi:AcrR family transcriptional regulator
VDTWFFVNRDLRQYASRMPGEGYAKGRARREAILTAAMELFAARGYRGTTIAQVAERVGITDAGLLHHFPTKEHLLVAVLAHREARDIEALRSAEASSATPLDALVELCRRNAASPHIVQLFTVIAAESLDEGHPGHDAFVTRYRERRRGTARALGRAKAEGHLAADVDVEQLSAQILAMYDGLQLQWLRDPAEIDMVQLFEAFLARYRA